MNEGRQEARLPGTRVVLAARRHGPIITPGMLPGDDGANINGPSLIRVPDWLPGRLGAYYLYFAHHTGTYIRLAYADSPQGPWRVHPGGALSLDQCPFLKEHIASPDIHVDDQGRRLIMYFHGPTEAGGRGQTSFAATSPDGIHFEPRPEPLGPSYARIFRHGGWWYGLFGTGAVRLSRSSDGLSGFEPGPVLLPALRRRLAPRHVAVQKCGQLLRVYYTRRGDAPERILYGTVDLARDWRRWAVRGKAELLRPSCGFEGNEQPVRRSRMGAARGRENALRDPAIFEEDGRTWLLYAVAGESGIALAEIHAVPERMTERLIGTLGRIISPLSERLRRRGIRVKATRRIFIAGCARSGTTLARRLMGCFEDTYVHEFEAPFPKLLELKRPHANVVVKRTAESHEQLWQLPAGIGLIYCVRHPFDVLTSAHPGTVHLRPFHVTAERWEAEYAGLIRLRETQPARKILYLRYEDLIAEPDAAQARIAGSFGLAPAIRFSADAGNPIRATSLRKWERNEALRTYLQALPPAFLARVETFCREFGYELPADVNAGNDDSGE